MSENATFRVNSSPDVLTKIYDGCHGSFCYLDDNHTSVVGMRDVVKERGASVLCVTKELFMSGQTNFKHCHGNNLFAFPAQSNFSGERYPLEWINMIKNQQSFAEEDFPLTKSEASKHSSLVSNHGVVDHNNHMECNHGDDCDKTGCHSNNYVLVDAAGYVCTSQLDLQKYKPDFVPISFYKKYLDFQQDLVSCTV